jgi:hypothetical protein
MEKGLFNEFVIDILIPRLNSGIEIRTIDHLVHRLDLLYFDDAEKVLLYTDLLFEAVNELDPTVRVLLFYEIKLLLEQEMATKIQVLHKDFDQRRFELRICQDRIVLEARCKSCNSYLVIDSEIIYYLRKSNLAPYTPIPKSECPECRKRSIILPRL